MRHQSDKHNRIIRTILNELGGEDTEPLPRKKGEHHPDIIIGNTEIEVEMLNKRNEYEKKSKGFKAGRKRILILAIPDYLKDMFDEVMLWSN